MLRKELSSPVVCVVIVMATYESGQERRNVGLLKFHDNDQPKFGSFQGQQKVETRKKLARSRSPDSRELSSRVPNRRRSGAHVGST